MTSDINSMILYLAVTLHLGGGNRVGGRDLDGITGILKDASRRDHRNREWKSADLIS